MRRRGTLLRLGAFLVAAGFLGVMELTTLTGPHTGATDSYHAIFGGTDGVSGLRTGNPVEVAGVPIGKVTAVDLVDATHARVTFTANHNQPVTDRTWAVVRYANLLGQRYLALTRGAGAPGATLRPGATIPQSRTQPALSLTDLFNGFRPLFSALTPQQVNELSQDIVGVLQGETSRVEDLVARTASLSTDLGQRSDTFGRVLSSLSTLLSAVAQHDAGLGGVVRSLGTLASALDRDGPAIVGSLGAVDQLIGSTAGLLGNLEDHSLTADVTSAGRLTGVVAANSTALRQVVSGFADAFTRFARVTQNGSWTNIYLCNIDLVVRGQVSISTDQVIVDGLNSLLNSGGSSSPLAGVITSILGPIGLGALSVPVPVTLPGGHVGGDPSTHTAVCG